MYIGFGNILVITADLECRETLSLGVLFEKYFTVDCSWLIDFKNGGLFSIKNYNMNIFFERIESFYSHSSLVIILFFNNFPILAFKYLYKKSYKDGGIS